MGTSTSVAEFTGKLARFSKQVDDVRPALIEAAEVGKLIFKGAAVGSIGVTPVGKRKAIGVKDDFVRFAGVEGVVVTYTGPAHLLNNPTRPHRIYRSVTTARGRGARRANQERSLSAVFGGSGALVGGSLKFAGETYRKSVNHPGTKGKNFFPVAKALTIRRVPPIVARKQLTQPLRAIFG